jgi:prepilin-type N-terminal cleavage/methylation domain-containing protein
MNTLRSRTRSSRRRAGFSLAELLVAVVLLGIIGGALTRLVVDQMRFFDGVQISRGTRSAARNSMNVMLAELRMVQALGGVTNVGADNKSITVNVPYRTGTLCATAAGISTVSMLPMDSAMAAQSSYAGYAWRDSATGAVTAVASASAPILIAGTPAVCTAAGIKTLTINGRTGQGYTISTGLPAGLYTGWAVMFYQSIKYSFQASSMFPGKIGLYRTVNGGTAEELMAPFASTARFYYFRDGDDVSQSTAPAVANIRGVEVDLTTEGARKQAGRTSYAQTRMKTAIFFKNR